MTRVRSNHSMTFIITEGNTTWSRPWHYSTAHYLQIRWISSTNLECIMNWKSIVYNNADCSTYSNAIRSWKESSIWTWSTDCISIQTSDCRIFTTLSITKQEILRYVPSSLALKTTWTIINEANDRKYAMLLARIRVRQSRNPIISSSYGRLSLTLSTGWSTSR